MPRSILKGPFYDGAIPTRRSMILPDCLNQSYSIDNGKKSFIVEVSSEEMIGHKFGEFVPTRKKAFVKPKSKQKQKKR